jgi:CRP-like cAMP-binding protein
VRAIEYCNVYALDRKGFDEVLAGFPEVATAVKRVADRRRAESLLNGE